MIKKTTKADHPQLVKIWESAVLNTHDFLKEEDFNYYKENIPSYFQYVDLFGYQEKGVIIAFMGVAEGNIEMLFVHNDYRGKGVGKKLILYAINQLQATKVDVNEQNTQAVYFYEHMGFRVYNRSELDGQGKAYPILHMELQ